MRVAALREARGLNQTELAAKIGVKQSAISMIEDGTTKSLSGKVLAGLCEHLNSTPKYILTGAGKLPDDVAMRVAELTSLGQRMTREALDAVLTAARAVLAVDKPAAGTKEDRPHQMVGGISVRRSTETSAGQGKVGRSIRQSVRRSDAGGRSNTSKKKA